MMPTARFSFGNDENPEVATLLFDNCQSLTISMVRASEHSTGFIHYEMTGMIDPGSRDYADLARELMEAYAKLPAKRISDRCDDDDDGEAWKRGGGNDDSDN